jgi:hypothetical protein
LRYGVLGLSFAGDVAGGYGKVTGVADWLNKTPIGRGFVGQVDRTVAGRIARGLNDQTDVQRLLPWGQRGAKIDPQSSLIGGGEGTARGRIPLDDVPVTRQPTANTCVPASVDMLLEELAPGRAVTNIESLRLAPRGMTSADMVAFVADNLEGVGMRAVRGSLPQALKSGGPFIAIVDEGHAVVVQGVRKINGIQHVIVRDPLRGAYLEPLAAFDARLVRDTKVLSYPTIWGVSR